MLTERYPLEKFAAYNGSREVQMMAYLSQAGSSLQLLAVLTGLPPLTNGSWTIYTGFRCSTNIRPDKRGRPYPFDVGLPYAGSRAGLWQDTTRWSADAQGNAIVKWSTGLISLDEVAGRQLIVSLADGSRAACGPIQITTSPVAWLAGGEGQVRGLVVAVQAFAGVIVRGTLFGLDPSAVPPSWHIGDVGSLTGADVCKLEGSPLVVQLKPLAVSADGTVQLNDHILHVNLEAAAEGSTPGVRGRTFSIRQDSGSGGGVFRISCSILSGERSEVPPPDLALCGTGSDARNAEGYPSSGAMRISELALVAIGAVAAALLMVLLAILCSDKHNCSHLLSHRAVTTVPAPSASAACSPTGEGMNEPVNELPTRHPPLAPATSTRATGPDERQETNFGRTRFSKEENAEHGNLHRPRLLALHGKASNKGVIARQLANLGLADYFEVFSLEGPFETPLPGAGLESVVDGPFFMWYDSHTTQESILRMLQYVLAFIEREGPFDAVFGFSQGAAVLSACMEADVIAQLHQTQVLAEGSTIRRKRFYKEAVFSAILPSLASPTLVEPLACNAAIFAHAVSGGPLRGRLGLPTDTVSAIQCPSVWIIGIADPFKAQSEAAARASSRAQGRLVLYHPAAHELPRELQLNVLLHARMMAHLDSSLISDPSRLIEDVVEEIELREEEPQRRTERQQPPAHEVEDAEDQPLRVRRSATFANARFRRRPGATLDLPGDEQGEAVTLQHVVVPEAAAELVWSEVSWLTSIGLSKSQQLVRVQVSTVANTLPSTLAGLLAAQPSDAPCLRSTTEPYHVTSYGQLVEFIAPGGAGDLRPLGVCKGDVVIYAAPPGCVAAVAFLSVAAQTTAAPLGGNESEKDAAGALELFGAKHVIVFEGYPADGIRAAAAAMPSVIVHEAIIAGAHSPGLFSFASRRDSTAAILTPERELRTAERDVALLLRTSGTTSKPKGVPLQQQAIVRNAQLLSATLELRSTDVCLNAMPLFHIGGLSASILGTLSSGGQIMCLDAFSAGAFFEALGASPQPTWYSAVPTIHLALLDHIRNNQLAPSHALRFIRSGAAALAPSDGEALSVAFGGIPIHTTYSMSEQMPISQSPRGYDQLRNGKSGSVGVPVAASLAIVDRKTLAPLPYGQKGVIAISGPTVMQQYLNNLDANRDNYFMLSCATGCDEDAFFLTGDVGLLDNEGHLTIKGRAKELIKRGGEQVSPYEVEDAIVQHKWVHECIVFGVPSLMWGEEVGVAIVLKRDAPEEAIDSKILLGELRRACRAAMLLAGKWPSVAVAVKPSQVPRTSTGKPIRNGLAQVLGVLSALDKPPARQGPPRLSKAIEGVRYFLACQVVFNHVGYQPGGNVAHFGTWGAFAQARFFCIHVPTFFALGGFGLAANMGPEPRSKLVFLSARLSAMYPMYLISLGLLLLTLVLQCNPAVFDSRFHWLGQPSDQHRGDFCEPAPLLQSYWSSLASTIVVYVLGLQAWPVYFFSWFLSYYTWFSSVYYFLLATHPFFYSRMLKLRGNKKLLWLVTVLVGLLNYCFVAGWFFGVWEDRTYDGVEPPAPAADNAAELSGQIGLIYYQFPPFWWPSFAMGTCAAFLFDAHRPYLSARAYLWGYLVDLMTLGLILTSICYVVFSSCIQKDGERCASVIPDEANAQVMFMGFEASLDIAEDNNIGIRNLAGVISRLLLPCMVLWLYGLSVGEGRVCHFLSSPILVDVLAPASYNVYLFHQFISQMYYLATRYEWWSYWRFRKNFFWFSPQPLPVGWWEYFVIVAITTAFSVQMAKIDPWLVSTWERGCKLLVRCVSGRVDEEHEPKTVLEVVLTVVEQLTGAAVEADWTLAECGLASIAAPVLINQLVKALPEVTISLADLAKVDSIAGMAELLDERLKECHETGMGTKRIKHMLPWKTKFSRAKTLSSRLLVSAAVRGRSRGAVHRHRGGGAA